MFDVSLLQWCHKQAPANALNKCQEIGKTIKNHEEPHDLLSWNLCQVGKCPKKTKSKTANIPVPSKNDPKNAIKWKMIPKKEPHGTSILFRALIYLSECQLKFGANKPSNGDTQGWSATITEDCFQV